MRHIRFYALVIFLLAFSGTLLYATATAGKRAYWIESVTPGGEVVMRDYRSSDPRRSKLQFVKVWPRKINTADPFGRIFWGKPDPELELLREGFAQIKPGLSAPLDYQNVEHEAKKKRLGLWASPSPPPPVRSPGPGHGWNYLTKILSVSVFFNFLLMLVQLWGGVDPLLRSVYGLLRRRNVDVVFLGLQSAGKTWLWRRIISPRITSRQLEEEDSVSSVPSPGPALRPIQMGPMGKYTVAPVYVDTPGGQPGRQIEELLRKRRLPQYRTIWILVCSTTQRNKVTRDRPEDEKIDREYVARQLGYLALPVGLLSMPDTPKPGIFIFVIAKCDLFCESDPESDQARGGRERLQRIFQDHIAQVKEACGGKIPFELVFCSAREGWRTDQIHDYMEQSLFSR